MNTSIDCAGWRVRHTPGHLTESVSEQALSMGLPALPGATQTSQLCAPRQKGKAGFGVRDVLPTVLAAKCGRWCGPARAAEGGAVWDA